MGYPKLFIPKNTVNKIKIQMSKGEYDDLEQLIYEDFNKCVVCEASIQNKKIVKKDKEGITTTENKMCFIIDGDIPINPVNYDSVDKKIGRVILVDKSVATQTGRTYEEGYKVGYSAGVIDGKKEGYDKGYQEGKEAGYAEGYEAGDNAGYERGYGEGDLAGYTRGFDEGKAAGIDEGYANGERDGYADGFFDGRREGYEIGYGDGRASIVLKSTTITENGTYTAEDADGFNEVIVNVGGGPELEIKEINHILHYSKLGLNTEQIKSFVRNNFSNKPTTFEGSFYSNQMPGQDVDFEIVKFVFDYFDLSGVTSLNNSFDFYCTSNVKGLDTDIRLNLNLPLCKTLAGSFANKNWGTIKYRYFINFEGSTKNVTSFYGAFVGSKDIYEITNISMDSADNCTNMFGWMPSNSAKLKKLTFKGSMGGKSTTTTLTLDLSRVNANFYTYTQAKETLQSLDANTSGKTRIFKFSKTVYDSINADTELMAEVAAKNYSIASA